ncbi:MAG: PilZ domain-containing protein [Candidatus Acidiferrales bacterium]
MRLRVRPGEFDSGAFEEVANTVDASRKAFYFHTPSDRYHPGMRLRVRFPYEPGALANEADDFGEVIRVDKRPRGFGVAVLFWKAGAEPTATIAVMPKAEVAQQERRGDTERRTHERQSLVAAVELVDLPTGIRMRANTTDLSLGGCYVNTLNPFQPGTTLGVKIEHSNVTLEAEAVVCARFEGSGMCLEFRNITAEQCSRLSEWLGVAANIMVADVES